MDLPLDTTSDGVPSDEHNENDDRDGKALASRLAKFAFFSSSVLVVMAGLIIPAYLPAAIVRLVDAAPSVGERARSDLEAVPGIVSVSEPEQRAGDLSAGSNVFLTATAQPGLPEAALANLMTELSGVSGAGPGQARVMVELDLGDISIGISPITGLNPPRLAIARELGTLPEVVRVTVLWRSAGDDLIFDESNDFLDVWVQARQGGAEDLATSARCALSHDTEANVTVTILGDSAPRVRLYR
jgi:hypothetical protein